MEFSIQTIIAILIAAVVLLAIIVFLGIVPTQGNILNLRNKISLCCEKFLADDCLSDVICDYETGEMIYELAYELGMQEDGYEQLKVFCNCPES